MVRSYSVSRTELESVGGGNGTDWAGGEREGERERERGERETTGYESTSSFGRPTRRAKRMPTHSLSLARKLITVVSHLSVSNQQYLLDARNAGGAERKMVPR